MKSFMAVIGTLSLVLFVGSHFGDHAHHNDASSEIAGPSPVRAVTPEEAELAVPAAQQQLIDTINSFRLQYERALNEFQKSAIRRERSCALEALLTNGSITAWVGTVDTMTTTGEGNGTLSVKLAGGPHIKVRTWNNQLSDIGSDTLILPTSPVYNQVARLAPGQKVIFSGTFLRGRLDHLRESSMTEEGSMREPEFLFSFAGISPALSAEQSRAAGPANGRELAATPRTLPGDRKAPNARWLAVTFLGFSGGESPKDAGAHAAALRLTQLVSCDARQSAEEYIDCKFSGVSGESMQVSFFHSQLQRVDYRFGLSRYEEILEQLKKDYGPPRTLADPHDPSDELSEEWGGYQDRFSVSLLKTVGSEGQMDGAVAQIVFNPRNE